jgi:hypothetical protein
MIFDDALVGMALLPHELRGSDKTLSQTRCLVSQPVVSDSYEIS